MFKVLSYS